MREKKWLEDERCIPRYMRASKWKLEEGKRRIASTLEWVSSRSQLLNSLAFKATLNYWASILNPNCIFIFSVATTNQT